VEPDDLSRLKIDRLSDGTSRLPAVRAARLEIVDALRAS
jgi:hypothetical protein